MVPKHWTFEAHEAEGWTKQVGEQATYEPNFDVFLDGSGGQFSEDPRLRKCGWAWIQYAVPTFPWRPRVGAIWGPIRAT